MRVKPGYDFTVEEFADPEGQLHRERRVSGAARMRLHEVHRVSLFDDVQAAAGRRSRRKTGGDLQRFAIPSTVMSRIGTRTSSRRWNCSAYPARAPPRRALFPVQRQGIEQENPALPPRAYAALHHTFYRGHKVWLPKTLKLPCIIKPLTEEASRGISQAFDRRRRNNLRLPALKMIHERMNLDAIAEEYIDGRELLCQHHRRQRAARSTARAVK